jgi:peptidyl-prolyl cis-trans isomerase D
VRAELLDEYLAEHRSELFFDQSEQLANLVFEQPDSLQGAADALGLELQSSDWLTRAGGPGIGEYPQVTGTAFQPEILEGGANSEPVEISPEYLIVLRNLEHETARPRPLDEVRDEVRQQILDERVRELAVSRGNELLAQLRDGTPLAELASAEALDVQDSGLIGRQAQGTDPRLLQEAFLMPAPAAGAISATGLTLASGDYALLQLHEVQPGDVASLSDEERAQLRRELARMQGLTETAALVEDLRSRARISIPEQEN